MSARQTESVRAGIELRGVTSSYGEATVLRDVSITVPGGGVTALIGPNGAGKTTALRVMSGLVRPKAGRVFKGGVDVTDMPTHRRIAAGLCHVPEGRGIYRGLTVRENLLMQIPSRDTAEGLDRATNVFPILGDRLRQVAGTLSGGEQQMLALAVAYVRRPDTVLVDEPSLGLAPIIVDVVFKFLEAVRSEGSSLLVVDQYAHRVLAMADHAYVLRRGEIVYSGKPDELLSGDMFEQYIGEVQA